MHVPNIRSAQLLHPPSTATKVSVAYRPVHPELHALATTVLLAQIAYSPAKKGFRSAMFKDSGRVAKDNEFQLWRSVTSSITIATVRSMSHPLLNSPTGVNANVLGKRKYAIQVTYSLSSKVCVEWVYSIVNVTFTGGSVQASNCLRVNAVMDWTTTAMVKSMN